MSKSRDLLTFSRELSLPLDMATETLAFLGRKGQGKTYGAQRWFELLYARGVQCVALDPVGNWWSLRVGKDGKGAGLPVYVFGGPRGDVPLLPDAGAFVAKVIVQKRISVILDVSRFRKAERKRFMTAFAEEFFHLKKDAVSPVHLFIEEAHKFCLDDETEILTQEGWRRHDQIKVNDTAVAYDLKNGTYQYESISDVIRKRHRGPMVGIKSDGIDCSVTPDHRVVLRRIQRGGPERYKLYDWTFCAAQDVPTCVHVPLGGAPCGVGVAVGDDLLRLIGWVATDGNFTEQNKRYLSISQAYATKKLGRSTLDDLDTLLKRLGGLSRYERPVRTHKGNKGGGPSVSFYLGRTLSSQVLTWTGKNIHRIPRALITGCTKAQLVHLMQGLLEGDATTHKGVWTVFYPGHNEGLADDFQEIAMRLGMSVSKTLDRTTGQWRVYISRRKHHHIRKTTRSEYNGIVWCVTLPSGAFVARRRGRVFVTGNCPQFVRDGEEQMLGAMEDIVRIGRNYGIGVSLISQRSASVNKDVLSQVECLVAYQTGAKQDKKAIKDWVEENDEAGIALLAELKSLHRGEALLWSPSALEVFKKVHITEKVTFDASSTPKVGGVARKPVKLGPVDLKGITTAMHEVVEAAEANDTAALKRRVKALEAELAKKVPPVRVETKETKVAMFEKGELERFNKNIEKLDKVVEAHDVSRDRLAQAQQVVVSELGNMKTFMQMALHKVNQSKVVDTLPKELQADAMRLHNTSPKIGAPPIPRKEKTEDDGEWKPPHGARMIMAVLLRAGKKGVPRKDAATLALMVPTSGTFTTYVSKLKGAGFIEDQHNCLVLLRDPGDLPHPVPVGHDLVEAWTRELTGSAKDILRWVAAQPGQQFSRHDIADGVGTSPTSGTFTTYLSRITSKGLFVKHGRTLQLNPALVQET